MPHAQNNIISPVRPRVSTRHPVRGHALLLTFLFTPTDDGRPLHSVLPVLEVVAHRLHLDSNQQAGGSPTPLPNININKSIVSPHGLRDWEPPVCGSAPLRTVLRMLADRAGVVQRRACHFPGEQAPHPGPAGGGLAHPHRPRGGTLAERS